MFGEGSDSEGDTTALPPTRSVRAGAGSTVPVMKATPVDWPPAPKEHDLPGLPTSLRNTTAVARARIQTAVTEKETTKRIFALRQVADKLEEILKIILTVLQNPVNAATFSIETIKEVAVAQASLGECLLLLALEQVKRHQYENISDEYFLPAVKHIDSALQVADGMLAHHIAGGKDGDDTDDELGIICGLLLAKTQKLRTQAEKEKDKMEARLEVLEESRAVAMARLGDKWGTPRPSGKGPSAPAQERSTILKHLRHITKLLDDMDENSGFIDRLKRE